MFKPKALVEYTTNMQGCDLSEQLMTSYCMLHWSVKWWRKLFFHMFSLLLNNAYVLHKKFGIKTKTHDAFLENIVQYLVNESIGSATTRVICKRADKAAGCQFEAIIILCIFQSIQVPKLEAKNVQHVTLVRRNCQKPDILCH